MNLIKIESDVYFIAKRLKEIDESYMIFYNPKSGFFEVHSSLQKGSSYCFRVPYDALDERTIFYAKRTRSENRDKLIKEIEENNRQIEEKNLKNQVNLIREAIC